MLPNEFKRRRGSAVVRLLLLLSGVGVLGACASPASAQNPDSAMRVIRARYEIVTRGRARYVQVGRELDSLGLEHWRRGRGWVVAAFEGDTLRTIVATYGAHRDTVESYCFWAGAPIEIRVSMRGAGHEKTRPVAEQRFYFAHGYLIRWADPAHTIRPITTGAVFARAMHLLAESTRLVDGSRRERDRRFSVAGPRLAARDEGMRWRDSRFGVRDSGFGNANSERRTASGQ